MQPEQLNETMTMAPTSTVHLIPGTACDKRLWTNIVPFLKGYEVSLSGYESADTLVEMINCVAGAAPNHCHLVGFSLGGYLAAEAILKGELKVKSLTLIGTSLRGLPDEEKALRRASANTVTRPAYKGMSRRRLEQFLHPQHLRDPYITQLVQTMERDMDRRSLKNQLLATIERRDLEAMLPTIDIPVHLIGSSEDKICDITPMKEMSSVSNIHFSDIGTPIATTGHMMPLEAPQALSDAMTNFFNSYP